MRMTTSTIFKVLGVIALAITVTLLVLAAVYGVQTLLASIGLDGLASVGWNA